MTARPYLREIAAALFLILPGAAMADTLQIGDLVIAIPDDFELAHQFDAPGSKGFEFIRQGDDIKAWDEMVSVQVSGKIDARLMVDTIAKGFLARCPSLQSVTGFEDKNLPIGETDTMVIIVCEDMNTDRLPDQITMREKQFVAIRALQSEFLTYTMQYAWHHDELSAQTPFAEDSRYQTFVHGALIGAHIAPRQSEN